MTLRSIQHTVLCEAIRRRGPSLDWAAPSLPANWISRQRRPGRLRPDRRLDTRRSPRARHTTPGIRCARRRRGNPYVGTQPGNAASEMIEGPFMRSDLPIAGFAVIEAANIEEAVNLISGTPCAVAHGVVEVWPLQERAETPYRSRRGRLLVGEFDVRNQPRRARRFRALVQEHDAGCRGGLGLARALKRTRRSPRLDPPFLIGGARCTL